MSVFLFSTLWVLRGHFGSVLSLAWSNDDKHLVSCGNDGAIYEWAIESGERIGESVQKGLVYSAISLTKERAAYACASNGTFREVFNSEIVREINPLDAMCVPLTSVALARSDLILFVGNECGGLFNIQVPFLDAGGGKCTNYRSSHLACAPIQFRCNKIQFVNTIGSFVAPSPH